MDNINEDISEFENPDLIPLSKLALRIQLAATGIATSLLLLFIPNIETITFFCFLFGFLFSLRYAISTTLTMVIGWEIVVSTVLSFSGITFAFKLIAWLFITFLGNFSRKLHITKPYEFAFFGMLSALIFDIIVTISIPLFFISSPEAFLPLFLTYLIFGLPFTIIHIIGNVFLFALFPKLVSSVAPLFELKFPNFISIGLDYFDYTKSHLRHILIGFLILSTGILVAYNQYNIDRPTNLVEISVEIHYSGVLPDDGFFLGVYTNISFLEATQMGADVELSDKFNAPYVVAINGVWEDQDISGYSWIIYLNDILLPFDVGKKLSTLDVKTDDVILWSYESNF